MDLLPPYQMNLTSGRPACDPPEKRYILLQVYILGMRQEDIDWKIYHSFCNGEKVRVEDLMEITGFSEEEVCASLTRMQNNYLISYSGSSARLFSVQESILKCQMVNTVKAAGLVFENGIIKVPKTSEPEKK